MENLEQCVAIFTNGGVFEWVVGGLLVVVMVVGAFTKHNFLSMAKSILGMVFEAKKKK